MNDFASTWDFIRTATGLTFPESRHADVVRHFTDIVIAEKLPSADALTTALRTDPRLLEKLIAKVTVGETYFFRDPAQFEIIRDSIIPELLAGKLPSSRLRVWSAAAASGEEAYTMAIIAEQLAIADRTHIIATDIALPRLLTGRTARYSKWSLRGVPEATVTRYFKSVGDEFELAPRLRSRVTFRYLNLADESHSFSAAGVCDMDLILCRNVLIYFDDQTNRRVAQHLINSLSPDGWLLVGASDPLISNFVECDVITTPAGLAYRRPRGIEHSWADGKFDFGDGPLDMDALRAAAQQFEDDEQRDEDVRYDPEPAVGDASAASASGAVHSDIRAEQGVNGEEDVGTGGALDVAGMRADIAALYSARDYGAVARGAGFLADSGNADVGTWQLWIRSLCNTGATANAIVVAGRALDANPGTSELHYLLSVALAHETRTAEAIRSLRHALYLDRSLIIAHVLLGMMCSRAGDRPGAVRSFRNAADLLAQGKVNDIVPATDGESVGRIREVVTTQLRLLQVAA